MSIAISCPSCGNWATVPEQIASGKIKCPSCGNLIDGSASASQVQPVDEVLPASSPDAPLRKSPRPQLSKLPEVLPANESRRRKPRKSGVPVVVWVLLTPFLLFAVCCGGGVFIQLLGIHESDDPVVRRKEDPVAREQLTEADRMWDAGQKAEAVAKYKTLLDNLLAGVPGNSEKPTVYHRIIDFELEQDNHVAAREMAEQALRRGVSLSPKTDPARQLVAQVREDWEQEEKTRQAERERANAQAMENAKRMEEERERIRQKEEKDRERARRDKQAAEAKRIEDLLNPDPKKVAEGRAVLERLYKEFDEFKDEPGFRKYGFAPGGPYKRWQSDVQVAYQRLDYGPDVAIAINDLQQYGLKLALWKRTEPKDERKWRSRIEQVIAGKPLDDE